MLINNAAIQPASVGHFFDGLNASGRDTSYSPELSIDTLPGLLFNFLSSRIKSEGFYPVVDVAIPTHEGFGNEQEPDAFLRLEALDKAQRERLRRYSRASVWASLDGFMMQTQSGTKLKESTYVSTRDVFVRTFWRVYDASSDSLLKAFQHRDTLYWEVMGDDPGATFDALPAFKSTLAEIADYVADDVFRILTPYWEPIERLYYVTGNVQLKLAGDDVKADRWDAAAELWQDTYEKGSNLNRFRAAVNMSLYNEKDGNNREALKWVQHAKEAYNKVTIVQSEYERDYLNALERSLRVRIQEMERQGVGYGGFVE